MKETEFKNIWKRPKFLAYVQPKLTDEILANAEQQIGYKLPQEYIDLLKIQNGGYIRYELDDLPHDTIKGIGPYFPTILDWDWEDYEDYEDDLDFKLDGLLPFDGDGHWFICFDYRKDVDEPKVTFIDVEYNEEKIIADSFKDYLSLLELTKNEEYVLITQSTLEDILNTISEKLSIRFDEPDYFSFGYPLFSSHINNGKIWISPNKVQTGFVRETDSRYAELKTSPDISTFSLRYPELDENYIFINMFDDQKEVVFKELENASLIIKPISELLKQ